ncbi:L-arabinose isomerase [Luteolibacter arcticus]|uniref:L-arabinose isomerase n=1 Tax=Luteolibacter arcticus TaxID=1581411 RepID=A0ABT3GK90_9BACT|nr:L-arabinose isomerase [Luteolibacter arcticus]MCW1923912.1 L-arabinose isomerase [Luteolibacter arcticus]
MSSINRFDALEIWFVTGSQHLYGPEALAKVDDHAKVVVDALNAAGTLPHRVVFKPVLTSSAEVTEFAVQANSSTHCIGIVAWMHTFSPAKMWIEGLQLLRKPLADLHTQFNRDIPWETIDMDFMNLNQTAHGGREFGHIGARLRLPRKAVVGHWQDPEVHERLATWSRAARGWHASRQLKLARIGDNMRHVAVTEGDKVSAQMRFGWEVNTLGIGDLVARIGAVASERVDQLCELYESHYQVTAELKSGASRHQSLRDSAAIEIGLRDLLEDGGFTAFTTTFEDLHGMKQLPGLAVQRLMEDGYGFAGEGDWKTAALVRVMKAMAHGLPGGTSFMEDYTYHLDPGNPMVLGSHMLEICPSISAAVPKIEIHALGIGGKNDPCRMVFDCPAGSAVNASVIDLGNRFRFLVNEVDCVAPAHELPKLPVARVLWKPLPDLKIATAAWIHAGGAHHTALSYALTSEHLEDFAEIARIEFSVIEADTHLRAYKTELRQADLYYHLAQGIHG